MNYLTEEQLKAASWDIARESGHFDEETPNISSQRVEEILRKHASQDGQIPVDIELGNIFSEAYSLAQEAFELVEVDTNNHRIKEQCGLAGIRAVREAILHALQNKLASNT
jgi:hypothetical protein